MTIEALYKSIEETEKILKALELDGYYVNQYPYGEVKLDKHNLYPDLNSKNTRDKSNNKLEDGRELLNKILTVLNYSDGTNKLSFIAQKFNYNILDLKNTIKIFASR